jgi:signal peptidase I
MLIILFLISLIISSISFTNFYLSSKLEAISMSGKSMEPTFYEGDLLCFDFKNINTSKFERGDIIIYPSPQDNKGLFLKRIIGLPGEEISFENGQVFIDNTLLNEKNYLNSDKNLTYKQVVTGTEKFIEKRMGSEQYYVLGDNRKGSFDSRVSGAITKSMILGKYIGKNGKGVNC